MTRRLLSIALAAGLTTVGLVAVATMPSLASAEPAAATAPGSGDVDVVVVGASTLADSAIAAATGGAGRVTRRVGAIGETVVRVPAGAAVAARRRLARIGGVRTSYVGHRAKAFDVTPNDPQWFRQDSLRSIGLPAAWSTTTGSASVVLAIVDSGVNAEADLSGRILAGHDFVNNDSDASDDFGHGTDAALVAAAGGNNGTGAAGVCWSCKVLPVKVLDDQGDGAMSDVAAGVVWAVDHGANVVNLSLGGPFEDAALTSAVAYAVAHDVVVVGSAGNDGVDTPQYPAANSGVISVAGSAPAGGLYDWSQRGPTWVDVAAPGCNWISDVAGPFNFCGTSSSAPVVAGLAGLLKAARPAATHDMVSTALFTTADFAPTSGLVGYGVVDAAAAVATIGSIGPGPPPPPPDVTPPDVFVDAGHGYLAGVQGAYIDASDDQALTAIQFFVDDALVAGYDGSTGKVSPHFDTAAYADGTHVLKAIAYDATGHSAVSTLNVKFDNVNPAGVLFSPHYGATVTGSFGMWVYVTDGSGIMGTFLIANGRVVGGFTGSGYGAALVPVRASGTIRLVAITVDNAGRISGTNQVVVRAVLRRR